MYDDIKPETVLEANYDIAIVLNLYFQCRNRLIWIVYD